MKTSLTKISAISAFACGALLWGAKSPANAAAGSAQPRLFAEGEGSVCFVGDSITHHGYYPKHIALYYITRYPKLQKKFFNAGFEGGSANTTNLRLDADIAPKKADIYTVMLGMNDVRHANFSDAALADRQKHEAARAANFDKFKTDMARLIGRLQKLGKVVLMSSSIYDDLGAVEDPIAVARNAEIIRLKPSKPLRGVNAELNRYGQWCKSFARENALAFADHWRETQAANEKVVAENPHSSAIGRNRVHPFDFGGFFTAYAFLKDLGETAEVSEVAVDLRGRGAKVENASISKLKFTGNGAEFELLENALPYPLADATAACAKYCDFNKDLNRQILKVSGAEAGTVFELKIDSRTVGFYSAERLAEGVNLAENTLTPQAEQAREVERRVEDWRENTRRARDLFGTEFIAGIYASNMSGAQKIAVVRKKLESGSVAKPTVKSFEWYLENIARKGDFQRRADDAIADAYKKAQPRPQKYEIVKFAEARGENAEAARAGGQAAGAEVAEATAKISGGSPEKLYLYFAKNAKKPLPCVIFFDGGAGADFARFLAGRGYFVARAEYRAPSKYSEAINDGLRVLKWVGLNAASYGANPEKIGVCGVSDGAAAAMLLASAANNASRLEGGVCEADLLPQTPRPISACAAMGGIFDNFHPRRFNAIFACDPDKARAYSARSYLSANNPPTLLMHSAMDAEIPPVESLKMARALEGAGVAVEAVFYNAKDPNFWRKGGAKAEISWREAENFFDKNLKQGNR